MARIYPGIHWDQQDLYVVHAAVEVWVLDLGDDLLHGLVRLLDIVRAFPRNSRKSGVN